LSDTALVYGFADQEKTIDVDIIDEMVRERMKNSILPLAGARKSKKPATTNNDNFPWISPDGGSQGLKPEAEKKTAEKAVSEIEQTKDSVYTNSQPAQQEPAEGAVTTETEVPVAIEANSANTSDDIVETPAQAVNGAGSDHPSEKDTQLSITGDETRSSPVDQANVAQNPVAVLEHEEPEKSRTSILAVVVLLVILAVLLSVSIGLLNKETELKDEVKNRLAEVESMKQDMERVRQQAEIMQRERDAALVKAQQQDEQRAREVEAALEAANREKEAMAAAALAAEEAAKAAKQAEVRAKKLRLEEKRLSDERTRLQLKKHQAELEQQQAELERHQAELEQQRLAQQRRQAELEKVRVELEKAKKEKLAQQERERRAAEEEAELLELLE
jgi:hypothetical protein